ncbi:hypothetical protein BCR42DRAFT_84860 [Absidia repens]|uniref:Uncharacterized protein n=1 Tax=Absidia repens TaxID=90262 RepID=A0A1X2IXK6_9FUNG|nr:hypothetical protein BCR42DRAFT_84860 [Absidia repens]
MQFKTGQMRYLVAKNKSLPWLDSFIIGYSRRCTSAVSVDIEAIMYEHARKAGITLFTVPHRTSLVRHPQFLLQFDGEGHYEFQEYQRGFWFRAWEIATSRKTRIN